MTYYLITFPKEVRDLTRLFMLKADGGFTQVTREVQYVLHLVYFECEE